MAVDFADLRRKLNQLDLLSASDEKDRMSNLVDSLDGDSVRALTLMAAKRHKVKVAPEDTKTFELLENIIKGLLSEDCVDLAKQAIAIAPDWMVRTVLITSVNRFNTVDQEAIRDAIAARRAQLGADAVDEDGNPIEIVLAPEDYNAAAEAAAKKAAEAAKEGNGKPKRGLFGTKKK